MIDSTKSILAATTLALALSGTALATHANAESASAGVIAVKSDYSVAETVARIRQDVAAKGMGLQVLAYNMKRMINIFGVKPLMTAIAA
jgi:hypothetical protein